MLLLKSLTFEKAKTEDITAVTEAFETELGSLDCPMKATIQLNIAVDEIYSNIVKYAYPNGGPAGVSLWYDDVQRMVSIVFSDGGIPFNPLQEHTPDLTTDAEEREVGGLGIYLLKKTMDLLEYAYKDGQNILTIGKII